MTWESRLDRGGTEPETQLWKILDEMGLGLRFERNVSVSTPFRDFPVEADVLVEDELVIEVQSEYFHSKSTRMRKDEAKLRCFEALGMGVLWLYDDELRWACQVGKGKVWRPTLKDWIAKMLGFAGKKHELYLGYVSKTLNYPTAAHPELGTVNLKADLRRR